jgi:hypothetical protein
MKTPGFIKIQFKRKLHVLFSYLLLTIPCTAIARYEFMQKYERASNEANIIADIITMNVTLILSLPKSFGNFVGLTTLGRIDGAIWVFLGYWAIVGTLFVLTFKIRSIWLFVITSIIFFISSFQLLIVAYALMGI